MPQNTINKLLKTTPQLWKGRRANHSQRSLPTGHTGLDARLPGKGWPLGAVTELICAKPGLGEFSLLFPALADMGNRGQWLVLVDPPWIPYPASLQGHGLRLERLLLVRTQSEKDSLWACEQALRSCRGGAVLAWPGRISFARLRRLQLAAENSGKLVFLFRPEQSADTASPAALRLQLEAGERHGTRVWVLKCRGIRPVEPVRIPQPYSAPHSEHMGTPASSCRSAPCARNKPCQGKRSASRLQDTLKTSMCANRLFPTARLSCKRLPDPSLIRRIP